MTELQAGRHSDPESGVTVTALVPMRHHSERVPGKNYRELAGKPLFAHILETLTRVPAIAGIIVDTDSPVIRKGISELFPDVRVVDRPEELRGGDTPINEIIRHDIAVHPSSYYLQTHSTNPLLSERSIEKAISTFFESLPDQDSLFSVTPYQTRLWTSDAEPVNHDPDQLLRTQDLEPLYEENSCIYIFGADTFLKRSNRIGYAPLLFPIPAEEALDIDTELDFAVTECLMMKMNELGSGQ